MATAACPVCQQPVNFVPDHNWTTCPNCGNQLAITPTPTGPTLTRMMTPQPAQAPMPQTAPQKGGWFSRLPFLGKASVGCAGVLLVLCILGAIISAVSPSRPAQTPVAAPAGQPPATQAAVPVAAAPTAAPQGLAKIGERREVAGVALTAVGASRQPQLQSLKAGDGKVYLDVEVILENVTHDATPYNPLYFKVKDASGAEYTSAFLALDPSLKSGTLAKGEKVRGHVAFEILQTANGFVLSYEPIVIFSDYQPIRIDLGQ